jgi:diguanylate cyclase (GGDEF)-like protein/hemerythrin-like metal-binding protein
VTTDQAEFGAAWLQNPDVRELFRRFPLALALAEGDATPLVNARFEALLDPVCLGAEPLRGVLREPGKPWRRLRLAGRDGPSLEVRVQALRAPQGVMLVLDDTPDTNGGPLLEGLHARIAELERLSATDRLTGAWNRAHLDRLVESELSRSQRFRQPLSLVLLDIDHFKDINDTFGHAAGDAVLRELVQVMRSAVRSADIVFRWGGEEFVVLAVSTAYPSARVLAEKLRAAAAAHDFPRAGRVTVSAGVAEHLSGESAEAWFQRLDACLYEAKRSGRNRVCVDSQGDSDAWTPRGGSALRLTWLEEYECGEPTIDGQHRELFDLANALIDAVATPKTADVKAALDRLLAHVVRHFRDEEALLAQRGYEHLEPHARAHATLVSHALELNQAAAEGRLKFGEVVDFLANEVVARHLLTADRAFFPLFAPGADSAEKAAPRAD